jgi:hypothetical protein
MGGANGSGSAALNAAATTAIGAAIAGGPRPGTSIPASATADQDGVRPMTVAPPSGAGAHPSRLNKSGPSPDSQGGNGGPPPNLPPILDFSGGNAIEVEPGIYNVSNPVPVGKVAFIMSASPSNQPGYSITSYSWGGGTSYSSYVSGSASAPAPLNQVLGENVAANQANYQFIIDATPQTYSITLDVTYQNLASGAATLTFESDAPTGSLSVSKVGSQTWTTAYKAGFVTVILGPGINIQATASTDQYTGGQFMFMQNVESIYCQFTDPAPGGTWFIQNNINWNNADPEFNFDGPLTDDGSTLGYGDTYQGSKQSSWPIAGGSSVPVGSETPPTMGDSPYFSAELNALSLTATMSFTTYLMYQSSMANSVWIALSDIGWSWSETVASTGGVWPAPSPTQQPEPQGPFTPSGGAAFPEWVNTAGNFVKESLNPFQSM